MADATKPLGEFEHVVLLASLRLWDDAYGAAILREIDARTGRVVNGGALYITLDRLEVKGYLKTRMRSGGSDRGGRARRYVSVTARGIAAVRKSRSALLNLMRGLDAALDES
jgi:DNA-binding PadR family transcriptional regulator